MTALMGLGLATALPSLPSLAHLLCPDRPGAATAAYVNGMLLGEIAPVALTAPIILGLWGGSWRMALLIWSLPAGLAVLTILFGAPQVRTERDAAPVRWWPDWRSGPTWRLGLILGCSSITYLGANTFIPEYLKAMSRLDLIAPALTSLNILQIPASVLFGILSSRMIGKRWPLVAVGVLTIGGVSGIVLTDPSWVVIWAGVIGFAAGTTFLLTLAIPPLISAPNDIHRLTAAMFTVMYTCGFLGPLVGGALWDLSGKPGAAFVVIGAANAALIVLASLTRTAG